MSAVYFESCASRGVAGGAVRSFEKLRVSLITNERNCCTRCVAGSYPGGFLDQTYWVLLFIAVLRCLCEKYHRVIENGQSGTVAHFPGDRLLGFILFL